MDTPSTPSRQWPPSTVNRNRTAKMLGKIRPAHTHAGDTTAKGGQTPMARDPSMEHEAENSFNDEMRLFYHGPQATRGAGNNPGLGIAHRVFNYAQNDNPNTPFVAQASPVHPSYTRGPLSPRDRPTGPTSPVPINGALHPLPADDLIYSRAMGGVGLGAGGRCACPCCRCGEACCCGRGHVDQGLWVTLFGFPQGYQDGMLKILRDRGEILEHSYSGTNHLSVKFKTPEAVADAVGLNGSIMSADGLPGENYMIGVKRGASLIEKSDSVGKMEESAKRALGERRVGDKRVGVAARQTTQTGFKGSMGRFLSELFDITDLSIRD